MAKNKQEFKVGDLVRISRSSRRRCADTQFGMLGEVVGVSGGCVQVLDDHDKAAGRKCPWYLTASDLKLAKQAMRKRDEYAARR